MNDSRTSAYLRINRSRLRTCCPLLRPPTRILDGAAARFRDEQGPVRRPRCCATSTLRGKGSPDDRMAASRRYPGRRHFRSARPAWSARAPAPIAISTKTASHRDRMCSRLARSSRSVNHSITRRSEPGGEMEPRLRGPPRGWGRAGTRAAGIPVASCRTRDSVHRSQLQPSGSCAAAGATRAVYVVLRLPFDGKEGLSLLENTRRRESQNLRSRAGLRGGKLYDNRWGARINGVGFFADNSLDVRGRARRAGDSGGGSCSRPGTSAARGEH